MTGNNAITSIRASEAYADSGAPAISVRVATQGGAQGSALCTFSLTAGPYERPTPRDGGERFHGKGLRGVADALNIIAAPALLGMDAADQAACDARIAEAGETAFGPVGSAALSLAVLKAGASCLGVPLYAHIPRSGPFTLPAPTHCAASGSIRYGGPSGVGGKPVYCFIAYDYPSYEEAAYELWELMTDWTALLSQKLSIRLSMDHPKSIPIGCLESDTQLWDMMTELIFRRGQDGRIGIYADLAAHCFYDPAKRLYTGLLRPGTISREELIGMVEDLPRRYPFAVIEDPLYADDWAGFAYLTEKTGIQIVGDALFAGDPRRFLPGTERGAANALLVSPGLSGTVSQTANLVRMAEEHGYGVTVSASRGEGVSVCDFAAAWNCGAVRECGLSYTYNRFTEIEQSLGHAVRFLGKSGLKGSGFRKATHQTGGWSQTRPG